MDEQCERPDKAEDEDLDAVRTRAQRLLAKADVHNAVTALLLARRVYAAAIWRLQQTLRDEPQSVSIQTFFENAIRHKAEEEFTHDELMSGVGKVLVPWLATEQHKVRETERLEEQKAKAREEVDRRETWVPLALAPSSDWTWFLSDGGVAALPRGSLLLFSGETDLVQTALDLASAEAKTVLRLSSETINHNVLVSRGQSRVSVSSDRWVARGRSLRMLREAIGPFLGQLAEERCDLLVVDDLSWVPSASSRITHARAAEAQKLLKKLAVELGCAVVAGLPGIDWSQEKLDFRWTPMETYSAHVQLRRNGTFCESMRRSEEKSAYKLFEIPEESDEHDSGRVHGESDSGAGASDCSAAASQ